MKEHIRFKEKHKQTERNSFVDKTNINKELHLPQIQKKLIIKSAKLNYFRFFAPALRVSDYEV